MGSDPEQEDVEKRSQSCPQPRMPLQLPKGELETWSSGRGGMVIKVEIEPLSPNLTVSSGLEEVVSVRGLCAYWQQGKLGVQKATHAGVSGRLDSFDASIEPDNARRSAGISARMGFLCCGTNCPFFQDKGPGSWLMHRPLFPYI